MIKYIITAAIAIPLVVVLAIGVAYAHDEVISDDRVSRGVYVAGQDVSRLTAEGVATFAKAYEGTYTSAPVIVVIEGETVEIDPAAAGLAVDDQAIAKQAMSLRRDNGLFGNFLAWISSWRSTESIEVPVTVDDAAIRTILEEISETAIDTPAVDGAVRIIDGEITPEYPSKGLVLDVEASVPIVRGQMLKTDRAAAELPVDVVLPTITREDVDDAITHAHRLVESDVILTAQDDEGESAATIVFTTDHLKNALRSQITNDEDMPIRVYLEQSSLRSVAETFSEELGTPAVNAAIVFSGSAGNLVVVPAVPGRALDVQGVAEVVEAKAAQGLRTGTIPMIDEVEADFTTEEAKALGPFGRVSSFTTSYPCCQSRVTNIQRIARAVNGSMVQPGQTFSINARAGQRTESKGYVRAGAIINGRVQCCDSPVNVGGGTSQFATTFYNAIFFGCYQDVFHQPHSLYFSRYPYVREATLGFPSPDVKFRNDSAAPVYIRASASATAVTVTLYGNNGGRKCTSSTSGNTVTRTMTHANGTVTRQHWTWNYREPSTEEEPTTTTTTTTASTTTKPPTVTTTVTAPPPPTTTTTEPPPPTTTTTEPPPPTTTTTTTTTTEPSPAP